MQDNILEKLVSNGDIKSYKYINLDDNGNVGSSQMCNTQELILEFQSGKILRIKTFCSGSLENTIMLFNDK